MFTLLLQELFYRYDVRGALYDIEAVASYDPNSAAPLSEVEQKEEELCEYERYLALYHDLDAALEREGMLLLLLISCVLIDLRFQDYYC